MGEIAHKRLGLRDLGNAESVLGHASKELDQLIDGAGIDRTRVIGCSVTIAGAINPESSELLSSPVLGWRDVDIQSVVHKTLRLPLTVESIANSKVITAHCFGPAKGSANLALFNASLAVSASLIVDGHLLRGHQFGAGLIDAMLVPTESAGELMPVDAVAGGFGVIGEAPTNDEKSGRLLARQLVDIIADADEGDSTAQQKLCAAGRALAWVIAQTKALLHTEQLLVSGPVVESEFYRQGIRQRLGELTSDESVNEQLRFFHVSSHAAAHSLGIYHFLVRGDRHQELLNLAEGI